MATLKGSPYELGDLEKVALRLGDLKWSPYVRYYGAPGGGTRFFVACSNA